RRASSAAASPRTPTTSVLPSRVRSAARSAMSSQSHSAAGIIVQCIARVMSAHGGGRPALTRARLPAGCGRRRADWDPGRPNGQHYLSRTALAHPRTQPQRARKTAPPQRRRKKPADRIFQPRAATPAVSQNEANFSLSLQVIANCKISSLGGSSVAGLRAHYRFAHTIVTRRVVERGLLPQRAPFSRGTSGYALNAPLQ